MPVNGRLWYCAVRWRIDQEDRDASLGEVVGAGPGGEGLGGIAEVVSARPDVEPYGPGVAGRLQPCLETGCGGAVAVCLAGARAARR